MKVLGEMKRRNVFRVAIAYAVAAWVVVQIGGITADNFETPAWLMNLFITALVAGFPIVMYFSWSFEITPDALLGPDPIKSLFSAFQPCLIPA